MRKMIPLLAAGLIAACSASADNSPWKLVETVDPLDDAVSKSARVRSGPYAGLAVTCNRGNLFVYAKANLLDMDFHDTRTVAWRIDDEPPVEQAWFNGDKGGAGIDHVEARSLIDAIKGGDERLVIRSGGETVVFGLIGSETVIDEVIAHCER